MKREPSVLPYEARLEQHPDCEVRLRFMCYTNADATQLFNKLARALAKGVLNLKVVTTHANNPGE